MKRLEVLSSLVDNLANVVDVGCDHGYLAIMLKKKNKNRIVIASDVNEFALNTAIQNIKKEKLEIPTVLSNGLENIDMNKIDTVVIAGMGTSTIKSILKNEKFKQIKTIIIQANNDHEDLRCFMMQETFSLIKEVVVYENGHYYIMMKYVRGSEVLDTFSLKFGIHDDYEYLKYSLDKKKEILKRIPNENVKRKDLETEIQILLQYFKEKMWDY